VLLVPGPGSSYAPCPRRGRAEVAVLLVPSALLGPRGDHGDAVAQQRAAHTPRDAIAWVSWAGGASPNDFHDRAAIYHLSGEPRELPRALADPSTWNHSHERPMPIVPVSVGAGARAAWPCMVPAGVGGRLLRAAVLLPYVSRSWRRCSGRLFIAPAFPGGPRLLTNPNTALLALMLISIGARGGQMSWSSVSRLDPAGVLRCRAVDGAEPAGLCVSRAAAPGRDVFYS